MIDRKTLPNVLILLAAFVFFSANSLYFLEAEGRSGDEGFRRVYEFDFDKASKGPYLNLKSSLLIDYETGTVMAARNADQERPIASISKLITAMVLLDSGIDLKKTTEKITKKDARRSSRSRLSVGFEMTLYDLLHAALMNSDNRAARALARATSGSQEEFAKAMNKKAKSLGLKHSHFVEPTGLSSKNVSTAIEVAKILHYTYDYPLLAEITSKKKYRVKILNRKNTYREMATTNLLIHSPYKVLSGKTGYIRAADYCLASMVKNKKGRKLTLVVLGVPGDKTRFREARKLLDWGYKNLPHTEG